MVIALMVGWKWIIRIPLIIFWAVAIPLSFTPWGFLTQMCKEHVTTSIVLIFLTLYFFVMPLLSPFFPKIKNNGGEIMERSKLILIIIAAIFGALFIVALAAPGEMGAFMETSVLAPLYGVVMGIVAFFDGFSGSQMLAGGIVGGLVLAVVINTVIKPRIQAKLSKNTITTPAFNQGPSYTPPTTVNNTVTTPQTTASTPQEETKQ